MEDPVENIGAKLVRQAAEKANDLAGDGTTTSVVLAQVFIAEGVKVCTFFFHLPSDVNSKEQFNYRLYFLRWWLQVQTLC